MSCGRTFMESGCIVCPYNFGFPVKSFGVGSSQVLVQCFSDLLLSTGPPPYGFCSCRCHGPLPSTEVLVVKVGRLRLLFFSSRKPAEPFSPSLALDHFPCSWKLQPTESLQECRHPQVIHTPNVKSRGFVRQRKGRMRPADALSTATVPLGLPIAQLARH